MKIVCFSDIQFHAWQEFSTILPNGLNSRFQDQLNVLDDVFAFAKGNNPSEPNRGKADILIHTGDLFEAMTEKIDKLTFLTVYERFVQFSKEAVLTVLIPGNHDWIDKTETSHILEPFKEIENVFVIDKAGVEFAEDVALGFIPYTGFNFIEKVKEIKERMALVSDGIAHRAEYKHRYLFTHQGVNGAKVGPRDILLKNEYSYHDFGVDFFDIVFNGHYHKMQILGAGFVIVGSSLQKDFGERGDIKGFWVLDTKLNPQRPKFIETQSPRFFKTNISKVEDMALLGAQNRPDKNDFLWVISIGPTETEIRNYLINEGLDPDHVRIDVEEKKEQRVRTDISLSMAIQDQVKRAAEYMIYQQEKFKNLDLDRLVLMALDLYGRSQV